MGNVIIAVLATVLGFATSAVVTEVRSQGPVAAPMAAADIPAQFRPVLLAEAPAFVSTRAPGWQPRVSPPSDALAARSMLAAARSIGVTR